MIKHQFEEGDYATLTDIGFTEGVASGWGGAPALKLGDYYKVVHATKYQVRFKNYENEGKLTRYYNSGAFILVESIAAKRGKLT